MLSPVQICPVDERCFDVTSTVQLDGPEGAYIMWVLFNTRRSKATAECLAHWRDVHAPLAREHHGMCRYVQHVVLDPEDGGIEAIAELHFATEADHRDRFYLHHDSEQVIAEDVRNFAGRLHETHFKETR
jgi:uncharacterized protein (TIGR02118 family)